MLFSNKRYDESQNVKNKVISLKDIEFKFKIDGFTYWTIDDLIKEKTVNDCKFNLDTNQFIKALIDKALKEFILNHQYLMTEKLNREITLLDDKLDGREIEFGEIFKMYDNIPKAKEGSD